MADGTQQREAPTPEFECPGCHGGGFAGFDHYMGWLEANGWAGVEPGIAFGAWLANTLPGGWKGKMERLTTDALDRLDGSTGKAVELLTGLSPEELAALGGFDA